MEFHSIISLLKESIEIERERERERKKKRIKSRGVNSFKILKNYPSYLKTKDFPVTSLEQILKVN